MTQVPLKECIIKHSKFAYVAWIIILAILLVGYGIFQIKDMVFQAISTYLNAIWGILVSVISQILTTVWSIIGVLASFIPWWGYYAAVIIFGPLVVVTGYCLWIRLKQGYKVLISLVTLLCSTFMITMSFITFKLELLGLGGVVFIMSMVGLYLLYLNCEEISKFDQSQSSLYYDGEDK